MKWLARSAIVLLALSSASEVVAAPILLQEYLLNVAGTVYSDTTVVPGLDSSGFDTTTGLGTLVLTFDPGAAGVYSVDAYFDHELGVPFYNELGSVFGAPSAGLSWQIDEPGFGDANRLGTIFDNVLASALDNTNHVPGILSNFLFDCGGNGGGAPNASCNNDVAMALGFDFVLAPGEQAVITISTSPVKPNSGFFLQQYSPGDDITGQASDSVFLTGALSIKPGAPIPEPRSVLLFLIGLGLVSVSIERTLRTEKSER